MKEYGGYIEIDTYRGQMLHDKAVALNCGRNCLAYLIKARSIKKILFPYFMCDSVFNLCKKYNVEMNFYHVDNNFEPYDIILDDDTWLYIMNYYGQLTYECLSNLKKKYSKIIVDNAQAYYDEPVENVDTFYTCRKFFGVADGAFLYTNSKLNEDLMYDISYDRMHFLLGRFEKSASEFYLEYTENNRLFIDEPIKKMSKLTSNLLHALDYDFIKERRTYNFKLYHKHLENYNKLNLRIVNGAFAYPFYIDKEDVDVRKIMQKNRIYIPTLWPNVLNNLNDSCIEYKMVKNILPLPCDQRYSYNDIEYIVDRILDILEC